MKPYFLLYNFHSPNRSKVRLYCKVSTKLTAPLFSPGWVRHLASALCSSQSPNSRRTTAPYLLRSPNTSFNSYIVLNKLLLHDLSREAQALFFSSFISTHALSLDSSVHFEQSYLLFYFLFNWDSLHFFSAVCNRFRSVLAAKCPLPNPTLHFPTASELSLSSSSSF